MRAVATPFNAVATPFNAVATPFNAVATPFNAVATPFKKIARKHAPTMNLDAFPGAQIEQAKRFLSTKSQTHLQRLLRINPFPLTWFISSSFSVLYTSRPVHLTWEYKDMSRLFAVIIIALLVSNPVSAQAQFIEVVPEGDVAGLADAIRMANSRSPDQLTIIKTSGNFQFTGATLLPNIKRTMAIRGPARFIGIPESQQTLPLTEEGPGPSQLLHVEPGGSLRLDNVELVDFSLRKNAGGLIENEGYLHVKQVQLSDVSTQKYCLRPGCSPAMPAITNRSSGTLHLDQVSFVYPGLDALSVRFLGVLKNEGDAVMTSVQLYVTAPPYGSPISNTGNLKIHNSSFVFAGSEVGGRDTSSLLFTDVDGKTEFLNSIVDGFNDDVCRDAKSRGYNLHDSADCEWSSKGDLVGEPAGLLWRPVEAGWDWAEGLILTHALVPMAASAAVDSANSDWCYGADLLDHARNLDGNGDGLGSCDRGAVEAQLIGLAEGGINGLYYNPEADGHYFYILQTDFTTLVVWTTFDRDGNQAWVYGTGELVNGRSLIADTYINRNGGYSMNGMITPSEADHWGRIEVELTSCAQGLVNFYSDQPEFGNGQFPIERLAYVRQLGCND